MARWRVASHRLDLSCIFRPCYLLPVSVRVRLIDQPAGWAEQGARTDRNLFGQAGRGLVVTWNTAAIRRTVPPVLQTDGPRDAAPSNAVNRLVAHVLELRTVKAELERR